MNILDKIIAHKKIEIAAAKENISVTDLETSVLFDRETLSLKNRLLETNASGIIAEFKRKSPSLGVINDVVSIEDVTSGYSKAGANGLSVLTDYEFFGGSFDDFLAAREANPNTPMLRKDFMIDTYQIYEAKAIGADVILLIAACLTPQEIITLGKKAHELGLEVLLEVHDRQELDRSLCDYIDMVGVNNRNLKTFETNINTSLELAALIPDSFVKISESGLKNSETIAKLRQSGYKGFLIGESFMKTPDPAAALRTLVAAN